MAIIKVKFDRAVEGASNIVDTGTEGTRVATGNTAQRGNTAGQFRYNSTTGKFEGFDGSDFKTIENAPQISSVSPTNLESSQLPSNLTITGTNFASGDTVKFIGNDSTEISSASVTVNSSTQITAEVPNTLTSDNEPYKVKVTSSNTFSSTLDNAFNIDASPVFGIASGSIGTLQDFDRASSNLTAITATDDEGDSVTFSKISGTLPTGITFNSDGTFSGTANAETSDTTYTFTIQASDGTNTTDREYTITVKAPVASGGTITADSNYVYHTFLSDDTFTLNTSKNIEYLAVAGGGGGGYYAGAGGGAGGLLQSSFSGTASSYTIVIGQGGLSNPNQGTTLNNGQNGGDTTITGTNASVTAIGGGGGAGGYGGRNGAAGGSGGGGNRYATGTATGGAGTAGQGNRGGNADGTNNHAGGGGGAGQQGTDATSGVTDRNGGDGLQFSVWATATSTGDNGYYAGGGGSYPNGYGGQGGGGDYTGSVNALPNTGGGQRGDSPGTYGGSGIVILRYAI